jgi:hypothetical protein
LDYAVCGPVSVWMSARWVLPCKRKPILLEPGLAQRPEISIPTACSKSAIATDPRGARTSAIRAALSSAFLIAPAHVVASEALQIHVGCEGQFLGNQLAPDLLPHRARRPFELNLERNSALQPRVQRDGNRFSRGPSGCRAALRRPDFITDLRPLRLAAILMSNTCLTALRGEVMAARRSR